MANLLTHTGFAQNLQTDPGFPKMHEKMHECQEEACLDNTFYAGGAVKCVLCISQRNLRVNNS